MDPITVNFTLVEQPVSVSLTTPAPQPVTVSVESIEQPVTVSLTSAAAQPVTISVSLVSTSITVAIQEARDAYQLALAEGYVGTRTEWLASMRGDTGANAEIVVLTLVEYLALSPEVQMDGRWYVTPKT